MAEPILIERIEIIERKVAMLETFPARMSTLESRMSALESQFVQLRAEMHDGFSSLRSELKSEIAAGDGETRRFMRVLHEELVARIAAIGEGRPKRHRR